MKYIDMVKFQDTMSVELVDSWGNDKKVAQAARTSTLGLDNDHGKVGGIVNALWRDDHYSPFEHSGATFALSVPMFVRDQLVRHKSFSFSVKSLRYSEAQPKFYVPSSERPVLQTGKALDYRREAGTPEQNSLVFNTHMDNALRSWGDYEDMIDNGIADEVARNVLPVSLYTDMWMTGNLRSWLHMIELRADKHAQYEVRDVANQVAKELENQYPLTMEAFYRKKEEHGE